MEQPEPAAGGGAVHPPGAPAGEAMLKRFSTGGQATAADYFGYDDASDLELLNESFEETTRHLEEEAQLHMQQILGDGT